MPRVTLAVAHSVQGLVFPSEVSRVASLDLMARRAWGRARFVGPVSGVDREHGVAVLVMGGDEDDDSVLKTMAGIPDPVVILVGPSVSEAIAEAVDARGGMIFTLGEGDVFIVDVVNEVGYRATSTRRVRQ